MDKDNFEATGQSPSLRSTAADVIKNLARSAKRAVSKETVDEPVPSAATASPEAAAEAGNQQPRRANGRGRQTSRPKSDERKKSTVSNRPATKNAAGLAGKASVGKSAAAKAAGKTAAAKGAANPKAAGSKATGSKLSNQKLTIIPLGGLGEVGKNMTAFKYGNNIVVVDGGMTFPDEEQLGIDLVIPDYSYLLENKSMVRGIFVTHGHEDHIGALPYVMKDLKVPIYGSRLTLGLLRGKLKEHNLSAANLHEVSAGETITAGPFKVEFIHVSHSIPDSMALALHTPVGVCLHTGDFKIDMSPIDNQFMDLNRISELGQQGVLLLMADSTNVERPGFTASEKSVGPALDNIFLNATGRVIVTTFASNVHRIQQAIWAAERTGRKVAVVGRGMNNVVGIASELGYLKV